MNDFDYDSPKRKKSILDMGGRNPFPLHYYGDNVRRLFVAGAIIMLFALPFFGDYIRIPAFYYILGMIILGLVAGFTNPEQRWVAILNLAISVFAIYFFESEAISASRSYEDLIGKWYFLTNQILAVIFLAALYYSAKTERGVWLKRKKTKELE